MLAFPRVGALRRLAYVLEMTAKTPGIDEPVPKTSVKARTCGGEDESNTNILADGYS